MSSDKQLILIILVWVVVFGYQYYKDEKKKNDYYTKFQNAFINYDKKEIDLGNYVLSIKKKGDKWVARRKKKIIKYK